jgi:hypothetical protein
MTQFDRWADDEIGWDQDTGAPGITLLGNALQVWSLMQDVGEEISVADAAAAFKVAPARIVEAVEDHFWMYLEGPRDAFEKLMICHEGE